MGFWLEGALNSLPRGFPIVRVTRRELFCFVCRARMWIEPEKKKNVRQNTSFFFVILSSWHTYYFYHILFAKSRSLFPSQIQRKCIIQMYTFQEMGTLKALQTLPVVYFPDHHVPGCVFIPVHQTMPVRLHSGVVICWILTFPDFLILFLISVLSPPLTLQSSDFLL